MRANELQLILDTQRIFREIVLVLDNLEPI